MILRGEGFVQGVHSRVGDSGCVARKPSWGYSLFLVFIIENARSKKQNEDLNTIFF